MYTLTQNPDIVLLPTQNLSVRRGSRYWHEYEAWLAEGNTPEPVLEPSDEEIAAKIRNERNALLSASDWTQVADAPVDQAAWAAYRQALRDITEQAGFPENVTWPTPPQ